jgi:acetyl-CoA carboxylase biotin carboxylase subunit
VVFKKLLVANRGEIALRVLRTCREMGIKTAVIYSEADSNSRHVKEADEAYCVGPAPAVDSYLNTPRILAKAMVAHVDAIHPGYGFLSENGEFAEICERYGFKFIGPKYETLKLTGNKLKIREIAAKLGIPVVPGSYKPINNKLDAVEVAREVGYPVLVKPAAGGGGRGLRKVNSEHELEAQIESSAREAGMTFETKGIFIEKYIEKARHVEVQVLADNHGNVVHLGERDCTIQRRHQKLMEESPSPAVDEELRRQITSSALTLVKGVGYVNAGTVEFLLDQERRYYFIEMNSRIQVEHPVTEMVSGVDLIKQQIRIAAGEKLEFSQDDLSLKGWALECRVNAEDPCEDFRPSLGTIRNYIPPAGSSVRVDDYVYSGYNIPPHYDSLLGKVVVWGNTRSEAIEQMKKALDEFHIEGIKTTISFHKKVLNHPVFLGGTAYTKFAEELVEKFDSKYNQFNLN